MAARDHELLQAAKHIATALGFTPDEVMRRVVELGRGDRADWSSSELLLLALAQLVTERPTPPGTGGRAETVENIEAPNLGTDQVGKRGLGAGRQSR
ncbi:hypothetical protein [Streptosporangium sp. 'caverna']|uniref:hypothetical protein n=1 Tax=Streptosporangium sp. 'caverna' TaxID=2202249 RepID=UPI000D7E4F5C|nr:hypothetical protein [Streptosporangium sp. 'caverna']AWS44872.1 hypothetical protein DKM19_29705 [Streptosporangium sp. 'caverna']